MKSISNRQTDIGIRRHISVCHVFVLSALILSAFLTFAAATCRGSFTGSAGEITLVARGFEQPDDAAPRPRQYQFNSSWSEKSFPARALPEFLPGNFLSLQSFVCPPEYSGNDKKLPARKILTPAAPVRAGPLEQWT